VPPSGAGGVGGGHLLPSNQKQRGGDHVMKTNTRTRAAAGAGTESEGVSLPQTRAAAGSGSEGDGASLPVTPAAAVAGSENSPRTPTASPKKHVADLPEQARKTSAGMAVVDRSVTANLKKLKAAASDEEDRVEELPRKEDLDEARKTSVAAPVLKPSTTRGKRKAPTPAPSSRKGRPSPSPGPTGKDEGAGLVVDTLSTTRKSPRKQKLV